MQKIKGFLKKIIFSIFVAVIAFVLSYFDVFSSLDLLITDKTYSKLRSINSDVIIIGIDEETLTEFGAFSSWSRDKVADVINYLYSVPGDEPLVIGIDILFQGETNNEIDDKLTDACRNRNIVNSSIIKFKSVVNSENREYNPFNITMIEYAYDDLNRISDSGYANTFLSEDGVCRLSAHSFLYNNVNQYSFSYVLANKYAEAKNITIPSINVDDNGLFRFFFAGKQKEYSNVSFRHVANQKVPTSEFRNKVVLIGAYASAMQDEFYPTQDIGGTMYGVEIHANVFQSIVEGNSAIIANRLDYGCIFALVVLIVCFICHFTNFVVSIILPLVTMAVHMLFGRYLTNVGLIIPQVYSIFIFGLLTIYLIIRRFYIEWKRRKHITSIFNRYMDPKLVNNFAKDESNEINLSGEKRYVSVLFVDIRGFTTMSESMQPEDVVGVLNEYLSYVTECIFKHNGMLDKFIGDAAMAIFNAPVDQDDYIYESVACAYDIAQGSKEISEKLFAKYGKSVSYGVGVHCGEAVIGNIGSKTRMDYTAIGDTVNTSSRIEGKAQKGEILISAVVKEKLEGRIIVEDAGKIELKGKAEPVSVYRLIGLVNKEVD